MSKSKKMAAMSRRTQSSKLNNPWDKHPPMSVDHSAEYLYHKALDEAKKLSIPINIRLEHVKSMIILSKIEPCFSDLVMKYPDNGYMLGNVSIRSNV